MFQMFVKKSDSYSRHTVLKDKNIDDQLLFGQH